MPEMPIVDLSAAAEDTLTRVQRESDEWRRRAYPDTYTLPLQALGVGEEAGELQHAVLKYMQGIRGYDYEKTQAEVADAIGDIVIYACGVAQLLGIDVRAAVAAAWKHVKDRNITQNSDPGPEIIDRLAEPSPIAKSVPHVGPISLSEDLAEPFPSNEV